MQEYKLKFLILGAPQTGKSSMMYRLLGYTRHEPLIKVEAYKWYIEGKVVNGLIQDLQDVDIMSSLVVPYVKNSAVIFFCYDPDRIETIDFLEEWFKKYFMYIPASTQVYILSTRPGNLSQRVIDLRQTYFCCKHITLDVHNEKDVETIFEKAGRNILLYSSKVNRDTFPGFSRHKVERRYCLWW